MEDTKPEQSGIQILRHFAWVETELTRLMREVAPDRRQPEDVEDRGYWLGLKRARKMVEAALESCSTLEQYKDLCEDIIVPIESMYPTPTHGGSQ